MKPSDEIAQSQSKSLSLEFDLPHAPEKVWRALTDPALLAEWLLPVLNFKLDRGAPFTFKTQAFPGAGWDGTVNCRMLEIEAHRKISYTWSVPSLDTVVVFTLTPMRGEAGVGPGTRLTIVQSGFKPDQKAEFGGARYGWKMMGDKLIDLLATMP